jgi:hypothetical protein
MGIRAILESVMIDKVGDHNGFTANVDAFQGMGYLSVRQRGILDSILEAGHAAIHRKWHPTPDDINALLDITESVVELGYLHENRAGELEKRVPKRERRRPRS